MKILFIIISVLFETVLYGQDTLLVKRIPEKYSKKFAIINIIDLKQQLDLNDINLANVPNNTIVLIPLQSIYNNENLELQRTIRKKTPTNDPEWKTKQRALLDTLKNVLNEGKTILLKDSNYPEVCQLIHKFSVNDLLRNKKIALFKENKNGNLQKLKYRQRRIGAWRHFKIGNIKGEFYLYYAAKGTGSIYQSCIDGKSTLLGRFISFFQGIGW